MYVPYLLGIIAFLLNLFDRKNRNENYEQLSMLGKFND